MTPTTHGTFESFDSSTPRGHAKGKWVAWVQYALGLALMIPLALLAHSGTLQYSHDVPANFAGPDITEVLFQFVMLNLLYLGRVYKASSASPPNRTGDVFLVLSLLFALLWSASCIWITDDRWLMHPSYLLFFCTMLALIGADIDASALGRWREHRKRLNELNLARENLRSHGRAEW